MALTIFEFPIIHSVCPPNCAQLIVLKCSWENAILPGAFKKMVYADFGGQTECIMGNWKIEIWHIIICTLVLQTKES